MATEIEFQLPNTPPHGHTFPPRGDAIQSSSNSSDGDAIGGAPQAQHRRNASQPVLTIDTERARNGVKTQAIIPPPPARAAGIPPPPPPSHDLPLRQTRPEHRLSIASQQQVLEQRPVQPQYVPSAQSVSAQAAHMMLPRPSPGSPPVPQMESNNRYSASLYSNPHVSHTHNNSLSHAFAISNDPAHAPLPSYRESMMDMPAVIQSNPSDVLDLWLLASGQDAQDVAICYNLGTDIIDSTRNSELICLTSTGGALYTLRATANDLNVIRTHPFSNSNTVSIATPRLYNPTQASPLLTTIFPVLSKIRAIDEAASLALNRGLARPEALALERECITRAHATTAAPLLWNPQTGAYCLSLPVFSEQRVSASSHHTLPIEITPHVSIRILEPSLASSDERPSPILTYSIPTRTLITHTAALVALPSPYAVDILLSSMLALLLHLERSASFLTAEEPIVPVTSVTHATSNAEPLPVPTFAPPPLVAHNERSRSQPGGRSESRNRGRSASRGPSRLGALLHPARARSTLSSHAPGPDPQARSGSRLSTYSTNSAAVTLRASPPLPSSNTLAIQPSNESFGGIRTDFAAPPGAHDLEKGHGRVIVEEIGRGNQEISAQGTAPELDVRNTGLDLSRFQAYDLADPRLGGTTRMMLRILYWCFGVMVWIMGVTVGIFAEGIVAVTTCGSGGSGTD